MTKANLVQKQMKMGYRDIIKFQITTHCFMKDIQLSPNELECLTLLGAYGKYGLSDFCEVAVSEKIFKTPQTVRNFFTKAAGLGLVEKAGTSKKQISLNEKLQIQTQGNIVLDYKIFYVTEKE